MEEVTGIVGRKDEEPAVLKHTRPQVIEIQSNAGISKPQEYAWYAMRATYRRELEAQRILEQASIENFIPMQYQVRVVRGRKTRCLVPAVRNLVFVHAVPSQIKEIKQRIIFLQYITDSRSGAKIIVPDDQMRRFIAVAGTYDDQLLYFQPAELNLAKGTRVRITGGEFEGQEGTFIKVKGARDRRVVIEIKGIIAVAMAAIHPDLIEVIKD